MKMPALFRKKTDVVDSDNAVETKKKIIEVLVSRFKQLRFDSTSIRILKMTVWVADPVYISLLKNDAFVEQLHTEIENNFIDSLKDTEIIVRMGKPAAKVQASCILEDAIWFSFTIQEDKEVTSKRVARISVVGNRGSLKKKVYELDIEKRTLYHIGRGDIEQNRSRPYRENHIVVDDSEKNKSMLELNRHVSGSHADIIYDDGIFYLKATPYGCRPDGSKTSVIREKPEGTEEFEIRDSDSRFRLRDGDLIEFGESVVLQFIISK